MTSEQTGTAETFWESRYRAHERMFSGNVNPILAEVAAAMSPGTALDLGCGEGGDAIWLARQGWHVTAVDISATALARGARHAADAGVADRIDWQRHDLSRSLPTGTFDLISAQYFQSPVELPRERVLRSAAATATIGGTLLVVDHGSVPPWSWADPDTLFPTPAQLLASLELPDGQWRPDRLDAPSRPATGPDGQSATVVDTVVAVRRVSVGSDLASS